MEDFKDVILSEPPAQRHINRSGGPSATHSGPQLFENFKGILLCDRPADQKVTRGPSEQPFLPPGAVGDTAVGLQPSVETANKHTIAKRHLQNKKVQNTALNRHRRDLHNMSEQKRQERVEAVQNQLWTDQKQQQFKDQQSKLRTKVLQPYPPEQGPPHPSGFVPAGYGRHRQEEEEEEEEVPGLPVIEQRREAVASALPIISSPTAHTAYRTPSHQLHSPPPPDQPPSQQPYHSPPIPPPQDDTHSVSSSQRSNNKKNKKKKAMPKWAMTEEQALEAELQETDDLVAFANGLDFGKFLDDYEIREALSIMRERVNELKEEEGLEKGDNNNGTPRYHTAGAQHRREHVGGGPDQGGWDGNAHKQKSAHQSGSNNRQQFLEDGWDNYSTYSSMSEGKRRVLQEEATKLAEKILTSSPALRQHHSKHSLAKILEELTHKTYNDEQATLDDKRKGGALTQGGPKPITPPAVAVHRSNDGVGHTGASGAQDPAPKRILTELKRSKDYVQNLPYMYRCPSI